MTDTLYKVPRELTYNFQEIVDYIDNLEDRNRLLEDEVDALEETLYQRNELIKQLRNDIQLISENK